MKYFENEKTIWESKNKRHLLTTHRLREVHNGFFGSRIKSIMLEELTGCELRTTRQIRHIKRAVLSVVLINGVVFLLNQFLFKAELFKFLFEDVSIGPETAGTIFYISLIIAAAHLVLFAISVKKVFSFHTSKLTIDLQLRWLDFDERETFISMVEAAKDARRSNRC